MKVTIKVSAISTCCTELLCGEHACGVGVLERLGIGLALAWRDSRSKEGPRSSRGEGGRGHNTTTAPEGGIDGGAGSGAGSC